MSRPKDKQPPHTSPEGPELRLKINMRDNMLGPGKLRLLELIDSHGSIAAAAREMGLGYRRAWFLLDTMQACFAEPLVVTTRGGGKKGGAKLTETGRDLTTRHREFQKEVEKTAAPFLVWLQQSQANPNAS